MDKVKKTKKDRAKSQDHSNSNIEKCEPKPPKETNKISEIIRSVKKNSSIRLKGSRTSKVMCSKNVSDNNNSEMTSSQTNMTECSEVATDSDTVCADTAYPKGNKNICDALNAVMNITPGVDDNENLKLPNGKCDPTYNMKQEKGFTERSINEAEEIIDIGKKNITKDDSTSSVNKLEEEKVLSDGKIKHLSKIASGDKDRNRKLSLDHTILLRGESFSQSEADLNSVGKLPLERKSSFFRKKMESFLKNTSEVFRRQSVKRKGSMSLQSLPEHCGRLRGGISMPQDMNCGSITSLSSYVVTGSEWSLNSKTQGGDQASLAEDQVSFVGSQSSLAAGQPLLESSDSILSLNEACHLEAHLNSRAQSVSSGLDTATQGTRRRKATNRANRVTWLASEGLTNYLRRIIQDEEGRKSQDTNQEGSTCQELRNKLESKGRRLSYQRAVSGEDPVRYLDSKRRPRIPEHPEPTSDLTTMLNEFNRSGVPELKGFSLAVISAQALIWLHKIGAESTLDPIFNWKGLPFLLESQQAAIKEFIVTEALYIGHLKATVEVFIASAHALQDLGKLLDVETDKLFSNIPDILNVNLQFWQVALYPMLSESQEKNKPFNTDLMRPGFDQFHKLFHPYEKYIGDIPKALEYLKHLKQDEGFQLYLSWCHSHKSLKRLELTDVLVMPMQRISKYHLILERIRSYTNTKPGMSTLYAMEMNSKNYVQAINRIIRQKEEINNIDELIKVVDTIELDFKDEEMDKLYRKYSSPNLRAPMSNCLPSDSRCIIYSGDLRYRDSLKDARIDVRVILFTDMILICKKLGAKSSRFLYKIIRNKFMLHRIKHVLHYKNINEVAAILLLPFDDLGTAQDCIQLTEPSRNCNPHLLKTWELKIREAKRTYELSMWAAQNPSRDLSENVDSARSFGQNSEEMMIDREARERVSAMLYERKASTDGANSQVSMHTDSVDGSVQPQQGVMALVQSLPNLSLLDTSPPPSRCPSLQSASDKLYQSHQEQLRHRNPMATRSGRYLTPAHRGTSYPPLNPNRAVLRRGFAFSYSTKSTPHSNIDQIESQSTLPVNAAPSALNPFVMIQIEDETGVVNPMLFPTPTMSHERPTTWVSNPSISSVLQPVQDEIACPPGPSQQTSGASSTSTIIELPETSTPPPNAPSDEREKNSTRHMICGATGLPNYQGRPASATDDDASTQL